jgi:hypothetical protein
LSHNDRVTKADLRPALLLTLLVGCSSASAPQAPGVEAPPIDDPAVNDTPIANDTVERSKFSTNHDPTTQIRFRTAAEASERRAALLRYVWGAPSLPATMPDVTAGVAFPAGADDIDRDDVESVDLLYATISDSPLRGRSFLFHPAVKNENTDRVVIVHQGHARTLEAGVGKTAGHLLHRGFTVVAMAMPLYGWNGLDAAIFNSHDAMFASADPADGSIFRPFFEPVVQNVNLVLATMPGLRDISMIGLSGGGWTTALMAAVDPRISLTIQVAGSVPLYVWDDARWPSGDREQWHTPMFDEDIAPDGSGGGVATYLELYALGGLGEGRRAIQVTGEFDPCCFSGRYSDSYASIVQSRVAAIGAGSWTHVLDSTHASHLISDFTLASVLDPALGIDAGD